MNEETPLPIMEDWRTLLDPRGQQHVAFAEHYARNFNHGAPGHLDLLTIATLAAILDRYALLHQEGAKP